MSLIDTYAVETLPPFGHTTFTIHKSQPSNDRRALLSPDAATCKDCTEETLDPANRRFCYPFTNCTNCGPRFTIIQDVPYDRPKTTMRVFPMCPLCLHEYEDEEDRRYHAQPNACAVCGPHVSLLNRTGQPIVCEDAIQETAQLLAQGAVVTIKGLGGYHLACLDGGGYRGRTSPV